jgi:acetyl-CoA acetyltransferase/uncharacterized OB-fold protein
LSESGRILPQVTDLNEFYWASGADGVMRFQQCDDCNALIHPPKPICNYCRSLQLSTAEVSGKARIIGFTVNSRFALPGLPTPFTIGHVAIVEDDRVRLTTRIIDADPETLFLGQEVEVSFEHVDDVYFPLFTPTGATDVTPLPLDEVDPAQYRAAVRPMVSTKKYEEDSAISGIGFSQMGRRLMRNPLSLTVEAALAAIEDAGLTIDDIDGLSTYPGSGPGGGMGEGGITALEAALRIRPSWYNGGGETFGPGGSVIAAMMAVSTGMARHVLCFRTVWQSSYDELLKQGKYRPSGGRMEGMMEHILPFGASSASNILAMTAQRHMHKYGTTKETLGWIAINARRNAGLNPTAIYRDPITMDDYLNARPITSPFGLLDCDVPCDASVAVIVSAVDAARDLRHKPIRFEAAGTQLIERIEWDQSTLTHEPQVLGPAAHMWSRTHLKPSDVNVAELYDGFTINCISWLEGLGFCEIGGAKDFLDGGHNIALDGILPLNTHGGQLSHGRTHGMGLLHEAVVQLRGDAGQRQVKNAQVAVVSSGGLTPAGAMLLTVDS